MLPSHTTTPQWQSFEIRMRQRRADRYLQRGLEALNTHRLSDARDALAEAQRLMPDAEGVRELATRLERLTRIPPDTAHRTKLRYYVAASAAVVAGAAWMWLAIPPSPMDDTALSDATAGEARRAVSTARLASPPTLPPVPQSTREEMAPLGSAGSAPADPVAGSGESGGPRREAVSDPVLPSEPASRSAAPTGPVPRPTAADSQMLRRPTEPAAPSARTLPDVADAGRATDTPAAASRLLPDAPAARSTSPAAGLPRTGEPVAGIPAAVLPAVTSPPAPLTPLPSPTVAVNATPPPMEATSSLEPATSPAAKPAVAATGAAPADRLVRAALSRYQSAYSDLDAGAASAVYPSMDRRALSNAFNGLASQSVTLGRCDVQVNGGVASAECMGQARWQPKVGGGTQSSPRRWRFELREAGDAWVITRADVRDVR